VHQDLVSIIQEIVASVGAAAVIVLARALNRCLSRLVLTLAPRQSRQYQLTIDVGITHIEISVGISHKPRERKLLSAPDAPEEDNRDRCVGAH
jgi:hypothetical protein